MRRSVVLLRPLGWLIAFAAFGCIEAGASLPEPSHDKFPRWRGFNLCEKFTPRNQGPFVETDFEWISEWGFNFVRLPMDYRCWIKDGDWEKFNERALKEIDQAVTWGKEYDIHVSICFHRAPGYCVNPPAEKLDVWTNDEALRVCALHWATFAKRYKGIPNKYVSFDLVNEPKKMDGKAYYRFAKAMADAIRKEDPNRLIIADGSSWGRMPVPELADLKMAQSTRGYTPMGVSLYRASWIRDADKMPEPTWPVKIIPAHLYGPVQKKMQRPIVIKRSFSSAGVLKIRVRIVSNSVQLVVRANGRVVLDRAIVSGKGKGEWKQVVYNEKWKVYQNIFDRDYPVRIPSDTKELRIELNQGDWMTFSDITFTPDGGKTVSIYKPTTTDWGAEPGLRDRKWLKQNEIVPWQELQKKGVGVMVGEFGAFNKTPHDVSLHWLEDNLVNWKEAGWGWCLWNFRGSFGILDSGRNDVAYEDYHGRKLDRKMLELLRRY